MSENGQFILDKIIESLQSGLANSSMLMVTAGHARSYVHLLCRMAVIGLYRIRGRFVHLSLR